MKRFASQFLAAGAVSAVAAFGLAGTASAASPAASSLPTLNLTINGKSITASGTVTSGAVNVVTSTTNKDSAPVLFRVNDGLPASAFQQAFQAVGAHHQDLNYASPYGSIVFDADAPKGTTSVQTVLKAGTYVALDSNAKGVPPTTTFTVAATPAGTPEAQLPKPGATINTIDFGFTGATTIHSGEVVRFTNQGFVVHMNIWVRAKSLKDAKAAIPLLVQGKDKKAQSHLTNSFAQLMGPVSNGAVMQQVVTAKPGYYLQLCFMATQDGREHTRLGMEKIVRVKK